jgi:hypothetical protein
LSEQTLDAQGMRAFLEYAKAHQEIMLSMHVEEQKVSSYYSIGSTDHYNVQTPDPEPEPEIVTGPSLLSQAIKRLAVDSLNSTEPDPFIIGLDVLGEAKWVPNQKMAAFLLATTKFKIRLESFGFDVSMISNPVVEKPKAKIEPIKEIYCDDRSMGFVMRFRYLPTNEFKKVRDQVSAITGRQYHNGTQVGARINEPHWVISGDAPSTTSLVRYLWLAFNGTSSIIKPEETEWQIQDGVADRIQWILNRATYLKRMSGAHSSEWRPINKYGTTKELYPYQFAGIEYGIVQTEESRNSAGRYGAGVLIGDPMGLGKTAEAICAVAEGWERELQKNPNLKREDLRCLVVCPASVKINWSREVSEWVGKVGLAYTSQILRGNRIQPIWGNFVIINPSLIKKDYDADARRYEPSTLYTMILAQKWFGIIADESHQYKNERAERTKNVLELFSGKRWDAVAMGMRHWRFPVPMRIMLSGSPVLNRPEEYASQLDALGILEQFGGRNRFESMYCVGRNRRRLVEMHERLMERGYLRREKEDMALTPDMRIIPLKNIPKHILDTTWVDRAQWPHLLEMHEYGFLPGVLGQLPPKISTPVLVEITNRKSYDWAERNFLDWLKDHYRDMDDVDQRVGRAARNEALVQFNMLKHLAAIGKVKAFIDWTERFMDETEDQKLVVYVDHLDVFHAIRDRFPESCGILGGQTEEVRQDNIDRFQDNPKIRLMVAMLTAGGIGITLTAASHLAFLEMGWTPAIHDQAEARIWGRVNDLHGASIYWFYAERTVDAHVAKLIDKKRDLVSASTQGAEVDATSLIYEAAMSLMMERNAEVAKTNGSGSNEPDESDEE